MNKTKRIALGIGIVLTVLAVLTAPAMGYGWEAWFVPENSTGEYGGADIQVYINFTESGGETSSGQADIYYDKNCMNIETIDLSMSPFNWYTHGWYNDSYNPGGGTWRPWLSPTHTCVRLQWDKPSAISPGDYTLAVLTLHCNCSGCGSDLLPGYSEVIVPWGDPITGGHKFYNGTYTCTGVAETFTKELAAGWNLVSLPLGADDMTVASVFSSVADSYSAIYSYDAETNNFVALTGTNVLENGVGYFISMTSADTWIYEGGVYTQMNELLEPGLNMVGWLNCTKDIEDALSSIEGKYRYVARWDDAQTQNYEVYVPGAPSALNDFDTMEPGVGYFVSRKEEATLSEIC